MRDQSTTKQRFFLELFLFKKNGLLILFICLTYLYFSTIITRNLIFYYIKPINKRYWDATFNVFPEVDKPFLQNMFQSFIFSMTVVYLLIPVFWKKCHQNKFYGTSNLIVLYLVLLIVHVIRDIGFNLTRINSPTHFCMNLKQSEKPQSLLECFYKINSQTCGDLLFSGHNSNLIVISTEILNGLFPLLKNYLRIIMILIFSIVILIQGFFSVLTRR